MSNIVTETIHLAHITSTTLLLEATITLHFFAILEKKKKMFKNWVKLNCSFKVKTDPWNTIKHSFRPYNTLPASNESK